MCVCIDKCVTAEMLIKSAHTPVINQTEHHTNCKETMTTANISKFWPNVKNAVS